MKLSKKDEKKQVRLTKLIDKNISKVYGREIECASIIGSRDSEREITFNVHINLLEKQSEEDND